MSKIIPSTQRIELSPAVRAVLETASPKSELLKHYVRYMEALIDPQGLDGAVTPDARCHELEAIGLPPGREGLRIFRQQVNAAIPDEHISINAVRFDGAGIIETDLVMNATQTGELMGIPATGRKIRFEVQERCRFVDGKLAERWAKVDFEDIKRRLTSPVPATQLWFQNSLVTVRVSVSEGQDGISILEHRIPYGFSPPLHIHRMEDEVMHVLEGEFRVKVRDQEHRLRAGDMLLTPKGVPHTYRVESPNGGRGLSITVRGDFERFVREVSRPAERSELPPPAGPPSAEVIQALKAAAAKFGIEFVGPPLQ